MSAWSRLPDGRPFSVSSILTASTGPLGGAPMPVSGFTAAGTGFGFGVGLAEVVAGAVVAGGVEDGAAVVFLSLPVSAIAETPPATASTTTTPAPMRVVRLDGRAVMWCSLDRCSVTQLGTQSE